MNLREVNMKCVMRKLKDCVGFLRTILGAMMYSVPSNAVEYFTERLNLRFKPKFTSDNFLY